MRGPEATRMQDQEPRVMIPKCAQTQEWAAPRNKAKCSVKKGLRTLSVVDGWSFVKKARADPLATSGECPDAKVSYVRDGPQGTHVLRFLGIRAAPGRDCC